MAKEIHSKLLAYSLSLPGAWEDHPWGETVAKVGKKVFVFLGSAETPGLTVKLTDPIVHEHALSLPGAEPTGYGLGKSGWVTIPLRGKPPALQVLFDFIEDSYRAVATKKLISKLDSS